MLQHSRCLYGGLYSLSLGEVRQRTWMAPAETMTSLQANALYRMCPPSDGANSTPEAVYGILVPSYYLLTSNHSSLSTNEILPGLAAVPDNGDGGSNTDWKKWIVQPGVEGFKLVAHLVGTAAMMRRSLGGASCFIK